MPQTQNQNTVQDLHENGVFRDLLTNTPEYEYDGDFHADYFEKRARTMGVKIRPGEIIDAIRNKYSEEQIDIVINHAFSPREKLHKGILLILGFVFMLACFVVGLCRADGNFADLICRYISSPVRLAMGYASSVVPFSLFETLVVVLPLLLGYRIVSAFFDTYDVDGKKINLFLLKVSCVTVFVGSVVICAFIPLYSAKPIGEQMGFERKKITSEQLSQACGIIIDELNGLVSEGEVVFDGNGFSVMPYSFAELSEKVNLAYAKALKKKEFSFLLDMNVPAKPLLLSKPLTYTHLSGVYTPFTGEANINTNYPDYVVAFTCAHEFAHQRGVAPEDEANFMAYAVLENSDDPYLRYCANRYLFDYMLNALWSADSESYTNLMYKVRKEILYETLAYSGFFNTYRESAVSQVANAVNDTNLKLNNQSGGSESYGMVVDLATLYIISQKN